jgi:uncharacterized protein with HEPN domain
MAASKNPALRLRHILDEAEAIRDATRGITLDDFRGTWTIRRAVEHGLLIITEASKSLPTELKAAHPSVPWHQIEALGNVLRHDYKDVDPKTLWRVVNEQLPELAATVRRMLAELDR